MGLVNGALSSHSKSKAGDSDESATLQKDTAPRQKASENEVSMASNDNTSDSSIDSKDPGSSELQMIAGPAKTLKVNNLVATR